MVKLEATSDNAEMRKLIVQTDTQKLLASSCSAVRPECVHAPLP